MTSRRSLQVREDLAFERRQWRVQRAGWVVIAIALLLALFGAFGKGPLSHASAGAEDLRVEFERFAHADTPTSLHFQVAHPSAGVIRLAINRNYLDAMTVEDMRPTALRTVSSGEQLVFEFAHPDTADFHVSIELTPRKAGRVNADVALLQGAAAAVLHFQQFIYP